MILRQSFGAFFILNLSEINSTSISAECGLYGSTTLAVAIIVVKVNDLGLAV